MKKYTLAATLLLLPVSSALAHVSEQAGEHAEEIAQSGPAISSLIIVGVLGVAIIGFLLWILFKK